MIISTLYYIIALAGTCTSSVTIESLSQTEYTFEKYKNWAGKSKHHIGCFLANRKAADIVSANQEASVRYCFVKVTYD